VTVAVESQLVDDILKQSVAIVAILQSTVRLGAIDRSELSAWAQPKSPRDRDIRNISISISRVISVDLKKDVDNTVRSLALLSHACHGTFSVISCRKSDDLVAMSHLRHEASSDKNVGRKNSERSSA
jgi:Mg2+/Co2+ transporter CorC